MSKRLRSLVIAIALLTVGAVGGLLASGAQVFVHLNDTAKTDVPVTPNAQIQVIRLAPEDAPFKILVVSLEPGATVATFTFYTMETSNSEAAPPAPPPRVPKAPFPPTAPLFWIVPLLIRVS